MNGTAVVIGGGIVGSAIALELAERGAETVLVERDIEPQGASAASFASLSAFDEPRRDVYLLKTLGMVGWRKWTKRFGADIAIRWEGEIRWAENPEAAATLKTQIERAHGRGYPVGTISAEDIAKKLPESRPGTVLAASLAPEDGQADPRRTIDALRGAFVEQGGTILVGRASLVFDRPGVLVRVGDEVIETSTVVLATGAETSVFLERLGWEVPMEPSPGLLALTEPVEPIITGTVYVSRLSGPPIHLRQLQDGRVLIGERAQDEVAKDPTLSHARSLVRQAGNPFPALIGKSVEHFTVEWRPMPRDGMPIIGRLPGLSPAYVAAAHSGVTLAPVIGELVAQEILDGKPATRLEPCRPARFGEHAVDAYSSVEEAFNAPSEVFIG